MHKPNQQTFTKPEKPICNSQKRVKKTGTTKNVTLQICILLKQITIFVFFYFTTFVQNITYESDTTYFHLRNFDLRVLLADKKRSESKRPTRNDNRDELVGN